ncbi:MAG: hypothetical protein Q9209_007186 [Squamulea sp. 1 TL-2023]
MPTGKPQVNLASLGLDGGPPNPSLFTARKRPGSITKSNKGKIRAIEDPPMSDSPATTQTTISKPIMATTLRPKCFLNFKACLKAPTLNEEEVLTTIFDHLDVPAIIKDKAPVPNGLNKQFLRLLQIIGHFLVAVNIDAIGVKDQSAEDSKNPFGSSGGVTQCMHCQTKMSMTQTNWAFVRIDEKNFDDLWFVPKRNRLPNNSTLVSIHPISIFKSTAEIASNEETCVVKRCQSRETINVPTYWAIFAKAKETEEGKKISAAGRTELLFERALDTKDEKKPAKIRIKEARKQLEPVSNDDSDDLISFPPLDDSALGPAEVEAIAGNRNQKRKHELSIGQARVT